MGLFNPRNGLKDPTGKIIGVLGCVAQQEGTEIFERAPWVSLVCGSASYRKLPAMLAELEAGANRVAGLDTDTGETFETELTRRDHPFRAYVTIIEGCDKACTYCVVPRTRGPERSRASAAVLQEVREIADVGYSEVQLLGQTVNSYRDPSPGRMSFSELLLAVADVPGIRRVRFMTSHPRDLGADIVAAIDGSPVLCDHVHLPVQSGSTRILAAMQRTYSREEYSRKGGHVAGVRAARSALRPMSLWAFRARLSAISKKHSPCSIARNTTGSSHFCTRRARILRCGGDVRRGSRRSRQETGNRRLQELLERQRVIQTVRNEALVGQVFEVLVDGVSRRESQWLGRTSSNRLLNFTSPRLNLLGEYLQVRVTSAGANSLAGEQIAG